MKKNIPSIHDSRYLILKKHLIFLFLLGFLMPAFSLGPRSTLEDLSRMPFHQQILGREILAQEKLLPNIFINQGMNPADQKTLLSHFQADLQRLNDPKTEQLFTEPYILSMRQHISEQLQKTNFSFTNISSLRKAVKKILIKEGLDIDTIGDNLFSLLIKNKDPAATHFASSYARFLDALELQFLPDETPLYRSVRSARAGLPGSQKPNASDWGVGSEGHGLAESYMETYPENILITTTLGEMRKCGIIIPDYVSISTNAVTFIQNNPDQPVDHVIFVKDEWILEIST